MSEYTTSADTRKGVTNKNEQVGDKAPTTRGLNPAARPFLPKSVNNEATDKPKTTSGPEASKSATLEEEDFPGFTETHPIPVWISQESGQELSNSQLRRRRRWRKSAREAEARKAEQEKEDMKAEYSRLNEEEAGPSDWGNHRRDFKKKGEGFLNNAKPKPKDDGSKW